MSHFVGRGEEEMHQWSKGALAFVFVFVCSQEVGFSQPRNYWALPPHQTSRPIFKVALGLTSPQGREGLREFWLNGVGGSAEFLIQRNPQLALGVGADLSLLYFDVGAFAQRWPGVPLEKQNLFLGNVYMSAVYSFIPGRQTRPFLSAQLGAEFISEALYRKIIGGVRTTYYNVGGKTRLAVGVTAGATVELNRHLGIVVELKGTVVHNDPNVSLLALARTGVQYKF
jgi:hypothetical protein